MEDEPSAFYLKTLKPLPVIIIGKEHIKYLRKIL